MVPLAIGSPFNWAPTRRGLSRATGRPPLPDVAYFIHGGIIDGMSACPAGKARCKAGSTAPARRRVICGPQAGGVGSSSSSSVLAPGQAACPRRPPRRGAYINGAIFLKVLSVLMNTTGPALSYRLIGATTEKSELLPARLHSGPRRARSAA